MPVQDAARAACVSRQFVRSWRGYSNLKLNALTLGLIDKESKEREIHLIDKVDRILVNHCSNGVKVKTLDLDLSDCNNISPSDLDRWLRITVKSGIKELTLGLCLFMSKKYSFPCLVLSDEAAASSIRSLRLTGCVFHPTTTLGCSSNLKRLDLCSVHITENGLQHVLSKSFALEWLQIFLCRNIISLRIPSMLQQLKHLKVSACDHRWWKSMPQSSPLSTIMAPW